MNRFEYMRRLEALLSDISPSEKEEALTYYNDYFNDAGQENEQQVIKELGSPEQESKRDWGCRAMSTSRILLKERKVRTRVHRAKEIEMQVCRTLEVRMHSHRTTRYHHSHNRSNRNRRG